MTSYIHFSYLLAAIGFISGLKLMATPKSAKLGNISAAVAVIIAIASTVIVNLQQKILIENLLFLVSLLLVGTIIGNYFSKRYEITKMPELISLFNAFGGMCAVLIGINEGILSEGINLSSLSIVVLLSSVVLGGTSFSGSIIAYFKLAGKMKKAHATRWLSLLTIIAMAASLMGYFLFPDLGIHFLYLVILLSVLALIYGVLFAVPIGGADMPVLISVLNAATGVATALTGILFKSPVMILGGVLVGSTGVLLTLQMCEAMNRSLKKVLTGSFKNGSGTSSVVEQNESLIQSISNAEVATILAFAKNVAIIPGFGLAVSQAQKLCHDLQLKLQEHNVGVNYIIHPVAGRMPGHMNVLLAEADVDYNDIIEMEAVNNNMGQFDVSIVIGANDVVNPAAEEDSSSPVYGMPIIRAYESKTVIVLKRGMAKGYSGAPNSLFERANCRLLFGDAKISIQKVLDELKKI